MTDIGRTIRSMLAGLLPLALLTACGGSVAPTPSPSPPPPVADVPTPTPALAIRRTALPSRITSTAWTVTTTTRVQVLGVAETQRIETQARVSWAFDRQATGASRASGQIEGFTIRSSLDSGRANSAIPGVRLLLDGVIDSSTVRVVTRPPQANECDRAESAAAALARELLVRVPNGLTAGDQWKDSTVTLVCRAGVPITVYTTVHSRIERLTADLVLVKRDLLSKLEGTGGTPFRSLELTGTGSGEQRVEINAQTGILERLEGTSTITVQVGERAPSVPLRTQQVVQRVELKAERVR